MSHQEQKKNVYITISLMWLIVRILLGILLCVLVSSVCWISDVAQAQDLNVDLTELSIEELMDVEVTSVAKKPQKLFEAAAAIFVITQEDIRHSGVTSIPEALRMAPGVQVARIDGNKWAISSRGFNDRFANKLLLLIDGRSVYTPLFSGVFWDVQDTLLEDVERIEVIRGPGATLWGANAVNGVINILTKKAKDSQGGLVSVGGGTEAQGFGSLRYGATLGEETYYRVYGKYFNRDETVDASGKDTDDGWSMWRTGFRIDWEGSGRNSITLQGDVYDGDLSEELIVPSPRAPHRLILGNETDVSGANILTRWKRDFSESSDMILQLYYDLYRRKQSILYDEFRHTFDLDFQHRFAASERQDIIWGLGYRFTYDDLNNTFTMSFDPESRDGHLFSGFVQDDITLIENQLRLTLGSKFEHNSYTGFEFQPNVRLLWTANRRSSFWMAIARAVRTPTRAENDVRINFDVILPGDPTNPSGLPIIVTAFGDRDFESEELLAYEIGYRVQPKEWFRLDITAFYMVYDNLLTGEVGTSFPEPSLAPTHLVLPAIGDNKMDGETYGVELAIDYQILDWWQLQASYSYLQIQLHLDRDSSDIFFEAAEGRSPQHQTSLRSLMNLPKNLEFDVWVRYIDTLPSFSIKSYVTLDTRLGWKPHENVELSIVSQNLLDDHHPEFGEPFFVHSVPTEVERSVYGKIIWQF